METKIFQSIKGDKEFDLLSEIEMINIYGGDENDPNNDWCNNNGSCGMIPNGFCFGNGTCNSNYNCTENGGCAANSACELNGDCAAFVVCSHGHSNGGGPGGGNMSEDQREEPLYP